MVICNNLSIISKIGNKGGKRSQSDDLPRREMETTPLLVVQIYSNDFTIKKFRSTIIFNYASSISSKPSMRIKKKSDVVCFSLLFN